ALKVTGKGVKWVGETSFEIAMGKNLAEIPELAGRPEEGPGGSTEPPPEDPTHPTGVLEGHTEWVPDPNRPGLAQQSLTALEAEYTRETGLTPEVLPRPAGVTTDAGFNPETRRVFVYDDVPAAFR